MSVRLLMFFFLMELLFASFRVFRGQVFKFFYSKSAFAGQRSTRKPSAFGRRGDLRCDQPNT